MRGVVIKAWYQASRPQFFVATMVPLALGGVLAAGEGSWNLWRWLAVLAASFLVHLNTNLANDYFEYYSGADEGDSIGGSRVLQEEAITLPQIRNFMIAAYIGALCLGLWILWVSQAWWLIFIMIFAFLSSIYYTARPIRYGYHGLGELFVGINMGPVMVVGTYVALTGQSSMRPLLLSLPIGLMVALILYYQSFPDIETDQRVGKYTLAVRLGRRGSLWGYRIFISFTYFTFIGLVISGYLHFSALSSLITLPLAYKVDKMIRETDDWVELHGRGSKVRLFYLLNGLILTLVVVVFG
ncbi:MAG: 1,4-dihydroxy-2-naphthoate octaprenyltransferase [candidate division Zixibacteria bacterium HGW-Zixibacteria-1]|nr:MAG: 1,4-dihydroxy-2-naphthoate octaprenyltransferase [candidate division Zixibacteria bacterium HGW-Zixibacteria-1]